MSTTVAAEVATGRALRCRYLRKNGERCGNETPAAADDDVLLCAKHLFEAFRQFQAAAQKAGL